MNTICFVHFLNFKISIIKFNRIFQYNSLLYRKIIEKKLLKNNNKFLIKIINCIL